MAELFFWPALLFYGEAALGYVGDARHPGAAGRAALWGVRLGWLAQTALLAVQAARDDGFPWSTWAGSLDLFVWFVVSAYLFWGSRRPYRLLGLTVMPLAAALLIVVARGRRHRRRRAQSLLEPLPRRARRPRARRVRRLHARRRHVGALSLAGAAVEAAQRDDPPPARAVARDARPASRSGSPRTRCPPLTLGIARRHRPTDQPRRLRRRARDRDVRDLVRLGRVSRAAGPRARPAAARRTSRSPASCS